MEKYYFTFLMNNTPRYRCYHVEEGSYEEARHKMVQIGHSNIVKKSGRFLRRNMNAYAILISYQCIIKKE